jgi:hypothetical protein
MVMQTIPVETPVPLLHATAMVKRYAETKFVYNFSQIYYSTSFQDLIFQGANVAPTSQVCAPAMLLLLTARN